ncbi:MAG: hypothetical protein ABIO75_06935 [Thermomonas sp.]
MNWDPFQREVLAELGLVVYRQAGAAVMNDAEAVHDSMTRDSPMLIRVARAAGMSPETLQACIGDMQMIASLHGNASAKRALWPRLRALRRQHG